MPSKIQYNINAGKSIAIDAIPSFEKHREVGDCRCSLTEKAIVSVSESKDSISNFYTHDCVSDKLGQKPCVHTHASDQMTIYNDISYNLTQKQNGSNDSKDSNRYDKKLNQPSFKPSISNVFNSLNEYINAPTGSLSYVQPVLDDLSKISVNNTAEKDFISSKDIVSNKCSIPKKKDLMDVTDENVLDYKNILPVEASTYVEIETDNKQDNVMQNVSQYPTLIQSEKNNSNAVIFAPRTTVSESKHDNITAGTEIFKTDVNEKPLISDGTFKNIYESTADEQKHLDLKDQNLIDKRIFIEDKGSNFVTQNTTKLDTSTMKNEDLNENVKTAKSSNILSNMYIMHTTDTSDDFSEEKLNQYLLELEKEEQSKMEGISSRTDDNWSLKTYDELKDSKENTVSHRDDTNEVPIFERIMIGELPKISDEEGIQEKVQKYPVNITDVECNDTIKIVLNEKSNSDRQTNKLDKIIKDKDVIEVIDQDMVTSEDTSQVVSNVAVEVKVTSNFENVREQDNCINVTQNLQQDINIDMRLQDNNNDVRNSSENKDNNEKVYYQDIIEDSKDVITLHDNRTHDSDLISKMEITDACTISYTNENNPETEKPTRPQTLDIVSTHKNDCHVLGM